MQDAIFLATATKIQSKDNKVFIKKILLVPQFSKRRPAISPPKKIPKN